MRKFWMVVLPFAVLAAGVLGFLWLWSSRPTVATQIPEVLPPLVRVVRVVREDVRLTVHSQGTVMPRTESVLAPEVSGRIVTISPSLTAGGFFEEGDELLAIEPSDYENAVVRAKADVVRAETQLAIQEAGAKVARAEWQELGEGSPDPLVLHEPQVREAQAALEAAHAALRQAERNLERTRVRAPFAGRVRQKLADRGQLVMAGTPLARIYAVDWAEVRLPLPDAELAHLDLPLDYRKGPAAGGRTERIATAGGAAEAAPAAEGEGDARGNSDPEPWPAAAPRVTLRARFAGRVHEWQGRIVRTEAEIDPRTRMVHAVARVEDPYGHGGPPGRPPLAVGAFVEAEIEGRLCQGVARIPRAAMRGLDRVLVVGGEDRLHFRKVEIAQAGREDVLISKGLEEGERVCVSPLEAVVDGMRVRVATVEAPSEKPAVAAAR